MAIAVIDTGIRREHPDLRDQLLPGYDMIGAGGGGNVRIAVANDGDLHDADPSDPGDWVEQSDRSTIGNDCGLGDSSWHGTHVAGSVLSSGANIPGGQGKGVAPAAKLVFQATENWVTTSSLCKSLYGYQNGYYLTGLPADLHTLFQQALKNKVQFFNEYFALDLIMDDQGVCRGVIALKLDKDGCFVRAEGHAQHYPTGEGAARDATGAGDAFNGAFLARYLRDGDLAAAAQLANATGSWVVARFGARPALDDELRKVLAS